ncbi:MAG: hypothetical protein JO258_07350, partial [Alphaproteobacteria bacterium]|nr:hypothetical protein [Alphaproteobacteria bacterium]
MHALWVFVTDCGDSAVTLPLALLTLIYLAAIAGRRAALCWLLAVGAAAIAIGLLKLAFGACGPMAGVIVSPSGHTAMSTAIYGSFAVLASRRLW